MKPLETLADDVKPLLNRLEPEEAEAVSRTISRAQDACRRLEDQYLRAIRDRAAVHALLKKTSDDLVQRYQTIFEYSGSAMAVIENDGTISLVNSLFETLLGYPRGDIENKRRFTDFIDEGDREKMVRFHHQRRTDDTSVPRAYEARVVTRSGAIRNVAISVGLFPGTKQSIVSVIDITGHVQAKDALKKSERAVRNANRKLTLLASITRHDILNQLTILTMFLELLRKQVTDPALLEYLAKGEAAADTIRDQIGFSRDYEEIGVNAPQWQDVPATILRSASGTSGAPVIIDEGVVGLEIFADPLLEKVFYNLIENARKYGGAITAITFGAHETGDGMVIACSDDGRGIPEKEKENIFHRRYYTHTGFGLFLSREILEITGMTIRETGDEGTGARFEILVPKGSYRFG